ncbi:MAG: 1-aminocyclopropane-1-carboxylate deaminase [Sulfurimonadaceae bacterium]|jgi:1-aminocyclopropane-1-carboxylate deaminase/D-cysteine desulfhydrase-like pyridoxal-dependent ACC family enzyme|nr:1-aminocyclopropane-1-carboxylate deaminase [Sulfurimonadaceae bacterium]
MKHSFITKIIVDKRVFYIKRDDLIDPYLAGNKYRKLYTILQTPPENLQQIISYGGTQSNAMLAIAAVCHQKKWQFIYYSKPLSNQQKEDTRGNYPLALSLGMLHKEVPLEFYKEFIASLRCNYNEKTLIIDQGGANSVAQEGLKVLAQEIRSAGLEIRSLATPSGTGTTALFLALALPEYRVYTTPCIGNSTYLKEQMCALVQELPENLVILEPKKKYHFAKPYKEFYDMYKKLLDSGVEFDLLYAPAMWESLLEQTDEEVLYIHSGGVSANPSMLQRYEKAKKT